MKILVVDAHPDDSNVSAGGTIARLIREGHEVRSIYFSPCTEAVENVGHLGDHRKACEILGIKEVIENNFPRDGYLENNKQEVRDILWKIRELYKPDLVLCPSIHDFHQDHRAVADCCLTIFRDTSSILGFEVLRSVTPDFKANMFVILELRDVLKKMDVIDAYESQLKARPYFFSKDIFKAQLVMRGTQAKVNWAEAFEVMWVKL